MRTVRVAALGAAAVLLGLTPGRAHAHAHLVAAPAVHRGCEVQAGAAAPVPARDWPAPLDRRIALRGDQLSLAQALDRVAAAAGVRLTYSPELLPVTRRVCLDTARVALGDALAALLAGTGIAPVPAGADHVVLAPAGDVAAASVARAPARLAQVVVTGSAAGAAERASPAAVTVLDRGDLQGDGTRSLAELLSGSVPGVWLWPQSPTSPVASYGSVRGASSFGASAPKIYIDGIEVANPLLLTHIDPTHVERVEVIRGPQGAALHGADALAGVVHVVMRHDGVSDASPRVELRASAGAAASRFADGSVLAQDHAAVLRFGTGARTANLGITVSTLGAFVPGAAARRLLLHGGARWVGANVVATGTARFHAGDADAPVSPLLAGGGSIAGSSVRVVAPYGAYQLRSPALGAYDPRAVALGADPLPLAALGGTVAQQRMQQYTLGGTVTTGAPERWTHTLTAGVDGYRLGAAVADGPLPPSAADSALLAARGGADRGTLRWNSSTSFGEPEARAVTLTLGAEHSTLREQTHALAPSAARTTWWSNSGLLGQAQLVLADALRLTAGARLEHVSGSRSIAQLDVLPMFGAAWEREHGALSLRLRTAYGRGIRQARPVAHGAAWMGDEEAWSGARRALEPETQSGLETGVDLRWGERYALHVTRFDQHVSGLVQPVAVVGTRGAWGRTMPVPGAPDRDTRLAYDLQNVGAIDNRGWELQATAAPGPLQVAATVSVVDSRVQRLAPGYGGDLRVGDRMLEVPAHTLGLHAGWAAPRWSAGLSLSRAWSWIGYDRRALAGSLAGSGASAPQVATPDAPLPVGAALRDYWRTYGGVTRLGARASVTLPRGLALTLAGENLLDRQLGEPDDVTVLPGRTLILGLRTGF